MATTSKITVTRMSLAEWLAEGERRFGPDKMQWAFECPSCGNIQRPIDFKQFHQINVQPSTAYFSCIGRFDGHDNVDMFSGQRPCNYTNGGLFCFAPVIVVDNEGREHSVFSFAEVANG